MTDDGLPAMTDDGWVKKRYKPYVKVADRVKEPKKIDIPIIPNSFSDGNENEIIGDKQVIPKSFPEIYPHIDDIYKQLKMIKQIQDNLYTDNQANKNKVNSIVSMNTSALIGDLNRSGNYLRELQKDCDARMQLLKHFTFEGYKHILYNEGMEKSGFIFLNLLKEDCLYFQDFKRIIDNSMEVLNNLINKIQNFESLQKKNDMT